MHNAKHIMSSFVMLIRVGSKSDIDIDH